MRFWKNQFFRKVSYFELPARTVSTVHIYDRDNCVPPYSLFPCNYYVPILIRADRQSYVDALCPWTSTYLGQKWNNIYKRVNTCDHVHYSKWHKWLLFLFYYRLCIIKHIIDTHMCVSYRSILIQRRLFEYSEYSFSRKGKLRHTRYITKFASRSRRPTSEIVNALYVL